MTRHHLWAGARRRFGSIDRFVTAAGLEQMNVKLTEVVSDVSGVTGMAIIREILKGERNPLTRASTRRGDQLTR